MVRVDDLITSNVVEGAVLDGEVAGMVEHTVRGSSGAMRLISLAVSSVVVDKGTIILDETWGLGHPRSAADDNISDHSPTWTNLTHFGQFSTNH